MSIESLPTRREFVTWASAGIGSVALAELLARDSVVADDSNGGAASISHHPAAAQRVIHIVLNGGLSQVDSFDYKPALAKWHGKPLDSEERPDVFFGKVGNLRKSDWAFQQRGESGLWVSELFPHVAQVADELTVIHSMTAETSNHTPATFQEHTGFRLNGFPVMGAWLNYGLGSDSHELPGFVVIPDPRGLPAGGSINWTNGFLPAQFQGTMVRSSGTAIDDLFPAKSISPTTEKATRELLLELNRKHLEARAGEDELAARIRSYELAARMQLAVPKVSALQSETRQTHEAYGIGQEPTNDFGRGCLLARRLLEQGVRFVQLFSGGAFGSPRINWDGHEDMVRNHTREATRIDQPVAALIGDLRQRGLLDDTLVLFTSEFGRTPFTQSDAGVLGKGRDHNQYGFTVWMAGGGLKHGIAYGATDDFGLRASEEILSWHDFHATVLHLLGIDHERLTYYHNGIKRRLTDVKGEVIDEVLA